MEKRTVIFIVGSDSDLEQCEKGIKLLAKAHNDGKIIFLRQYTTSIHRNTDYTLDLAREITRKNNVDFAIVAAGWANHLTGTFERYLRNLGNTKTNIIGVACEDNKTEGKELAAERTLAAILGIKHVPGTQVIFHDYVGEEGARNAAFYAIHGNAVEIKLPPQKDPKDRAPGETLKFIEEEKKKKEVK